MTTEIKILHVQNKLTKEGKPYQIIHALVTIDGVDFVRSFFYFKAA